MNTTVSVSELYGRGVVLTPQDALSLVLSLIHTRAPSLRTRRAETPAFDVDALELMPDGGVVCDGCETTPSVAEAAILLQDLLARTTGPVRGGLRYAIARALHEVDAPPFDSVPEFARTLARYVDGDPREAVRAIAARNVAPRPPSVAAIAPELPVASSHQTPPPLSSSTEHARSLTLSPTQPAPPLLAMAEYAPKRPERRHPRTPVEQLRKELRANDRRLYEEIVRARAATVAPVSPPSPNIRAMMPFAFAALVASALALGGEAWHLHQSAIATLAGRVQPVLPSHAVAGVVGARPSGDRVRTLESGRSDVPAAPQFGRAGSHAVRVSSSVADAADDGGRLVPALDGNRRPVFSPAFASKGSAMFFQTGGTAAASSALMASTPGDDGLRVMTILDDGARNYHARPSPDGTRVAFDSDRDGERGVYVAAADGTGVTRVSGSGYAALPTWSPDGRSLAFVRAEPQNARVWNLWLLSLSSGEMTRLTGYPYGQTWSASWFPDGERICYSHEDQLIVRNLATGRAETFASPIKGHLVRTPAVSPDGTKVIFQVYRSGAWLLDLADGSMRCVLTDPSAEEFAWTPDGRRVAFHSRRDGAWNIWVMAPADPS